MTRELVAHLAYLIGADIALGGLLLAAWGITGIAWFKNVFRGWDYFNAALAGGDGRHSISAYCGANNTIIHRVARWGIDAVFGRGHCYQAAVKEGLLIP